MDQSLIIWNTNTWKQIVFSGNKKSQRFKKLKREDLVKIQLYYLYLLQFIGNYYCNFQ